MPKVSPLLCLPRARRRVACVRLGGKVAGALELPREEGGVRLDLAMIQSVRKAVTRRTGRVRGGKCTYVGVVPSTHEEKFGSCE